VSRITGTLREEKYTAMIISRSVLLLIGNVLYKIHRENRSIEFYVSLRVAANRVVYEIVWAGGIYRAGDAAWHYNTAHARVAGWVTEVKETLRICNTDSFSTITIVMRTRLNVTLNEHQFSCLRLFSYCDDRTKGVALKEGRSLKL